MSPGPARPQAGHVAVGHQPDLAGLGLKPHLVDTFKLSTDPVHRQRTGG
jgi:hypothetical protein